MSPTPALDEHGVLRFEFKFLGAPVRLVWKAWREDWHLQSWWAQTVKMRFRPGGKLLLGWPSNGSELRGRFVDILDQKLLAFTWQWSHDPDAYPLLTTLRFVEEDNGLSTVLKIEQRSFDAVDDAALVTEMIEGWQHFLPKLETYLGQMTLV